MTTKKSKFEQKQVIHRIIDKLLHQIDEDYREILKKEQEYQLTSEFCDSIQFNSYFHATPEELQIFKNLASNFPSWETVKITDCKTKEVVFERIGT